MVRDVRGQLISQEDDPFNVWSRRNVRNTPCHTYNCGGYALETFSWYCPMFPQDWEEDNVPFYLEDNEDDWDKATERCVRVMCMELGNVRPIPAIDHLEENEYAVAFRIRDGDFHFVKRASNGHWYQKMGGGSITTMTVDQVFSEDWGWDYIGPIVLLAVRRS